MKIFLHFSVGTILLLISSLSPRSAWAIFQDKTAEQPNGLIFVQFSEAEYSTLEETGTVTVTVTLSAPSPIPITVTVTTSGGSAVAGTDFMPVNAPIQISSGVSEYQMQIEIIDDSQVENNETFSLSLSDPVNASLGSPTNTQITIFDGDGFRNSGISFPGFSVAVCAWADFDNDGDLDVLAGGDFSNKLYRNNGLSGFSEISANLPNWRLRVAVAGDYDNDGDLDLVLSGWTQSGTNNSAIALYNNNGTGVFQSSGIPLGPPYANDADWGDYDNDGDLDLLTVGDTSMMGPSVTKLYRNDGSGIFADTGAALTQIGGGSAAWADYDNDGYLDLMLTGNRIIGSTLYEGVTVLYHNNGNGQLTMVANLIGMSNGSIAWGDYDSDGDLDVLVNGYTASYSPPPSANKLYRNDQGTFTQVSAGLPDGAGYNAWGDFDNDGDLDLLLTGISNSSPSARVFRNDGGVFVDIVTGLSGNMLGSGSGWGDYDNDGSLDLLLTDSSSVYIFQNKSIIHNTPPSPPDDLNVVLTDNLAVLQWSPASDSQTQNNLLTYDLRIGTFAGGQNIASPAANLVTGYRILPAPSHLGLGTTAVLRGLDSGRTYYWSVQAVDSSFAGSAFSSEGSFTTLNISVNFNPDSLVVSEDSGIATLNVTLSSASSKQISVNYLTESVTATEGLDFTATSGTLTFAPGQRNASFNISIIDDTLPTFEGDETFRVVLSDPINAVLGDDPVSTITIQDNEPEPQLTFGQASLTLTEDTASTPVTLTLSAPAGVTVTVNYQTSNQSAVEGQDFILASGQLVFPPGSLNQSFNLALIDDAMDEPPETFLLTISDAVNATVGQSSQTVTIEDNDTMPHIFLSPATLNVKEDGGEAVVTATLSAPSGFFITVQFFTSNLSALAGSDFSPTSGTLTFDPGVQTRAITIPILEDDVTEGDESFLVTIVSPTNALLTEPGTSIIRIKEFTPLLVSFAGADLSVSENIGMVAITISLSSSSDFPASVKIFSSGVTATSGSDYEAINRTLSFPPGQHEQVIYLTILMDQVTEPFETLVILLAHPTDALLGEPNALLITIVDAPYIPQFAIYLPIIKR